MRGNMHDNQEEAVSKQTKSKKKHIGVIFFSVVILLIIGVIATYILTTDMRAYRNAMKAFDSQKYSEALEMFMELEGYKDSTELSRECIYEQALSDFNKKSYDTALEHFSAISDYKDVAEYILQCEYELMSVDEQFMTVLAKGLERRWDDANSMKDDDPNWNTTMRTVVSAELEPLKEFEERTFGDLELETKAMAYIAELERSLEALDYYMSNYERYNSLWGTAYSARSLLIRDFYEKYNLNVDESHKATLDDFLGNARVLEEFANIEEELQLVFDKAVESGMSIEDDGHGWKTISATFTNETSVTFSTFGLNIQLKDIDGNIVDTSYDRVDEWLPGQTVIFTFGTNKNIDSYYMWSNPLEDYFVK